MQRCYGQLLVFAATVGAQCSKMAFDGNRVVDPSSKYGGHGCRGWPLLEKHFGVVARATAVIDYCSVGDTKHACGFDIVDCAKRKRLGGVRVLVTLTGSKVIDAAVAQRVDDDTPRVRWIPEQAGSYEVAPMLNWLYQDAADAPQIDAYPNSGDPIYLGPTENRCPGGRCGHAQPFTLEACVKVAAVPFAPTMFRAVDSEASLPEKLLPPCRDNGSGYWRRQVDGLVFARGDCTVQRFSGDAAEACLALRRVKVVAFLGDSLVRDVWAAFGRRLNVTVDERNFRAQRFAGATATVASTEGLRVHFSQIWGLDGLWRCGLLPRNLACCGFEPVASGERPPDAAELFGDALPLGPGEILVFANFGILHMPASAGDPTKFEARTRHALRRLGAIGKAAGLVVTVVLVTPPTLRGLRNPGLHPAQLEAFAPAMRRLATEDLGPSVKVLDLAPLTAARADATADGLHYGKEVPAAAVDAALGLVCELQ